MSEQPDLLAMARAAGAEAGRAVLAEARADRPEWLNQSDAALYVNLAEPSLNRFIKEGRGPRDVRIGTKWRTRRQWLDEWILGGAWHAKQPAA